MERNRWHSSLRVKVFGLILTVMLLIGAGLSVWGYWDAEEEILEQNLQLAQMFQKEVSNAISSKGTDIAMAVKVLLADDPIVESFARRDRDQLLALTLPLFQKYLGPEDGMSQFQFHLPPAISFLRVHQPKKFGDDLASFRKTVVVANESRKPVVGLEVGVAGPGLRVVYPVSYQGQHVGSVELGGELNRIFSGAAEMTGTRFAIGIRNTLFAEVKRNGDPARDVVLDDLVFYEFSDPTVRTILPALHAQPQGRLATLNGGKWMYRSFPLHDFSGQEMGRILVAKDVSEMVENIRRGLWKRIALNLLLSVLVSGAMFWFFRTWVLTPIQQAVGLAHRLSEGDLAIHLDDHRQDELGTLAKALNRMAGEIRKIIGDVVERATVLEEASVRFKRIAGELSSGAGELDHRSSSASRATERMNGAMGGISNAVGLLSSKMEMVSSTSGEMWDNMNTISAAVEEASASLAQVASSSEQVSGHVGTVRHSADRTNGNIRAVAGSIQELTASLNQVRSKCDDAMAQAQQAGKDGEIAQAVIADLAKSAEQIGGVVAMINTIAEQTNMLALNASIEAAGAGEAGKGFSVVANEVKALARQTREATQTISRHIEEIQGKSREAARVMEQVTRIVNSTREANEAILVAVREQGDVVTEITQAMSAAAMETTEVTRLVGESSEAIVGVSRNVQEVAFGIQEVTRSVSSAAGGIGSLNQTVADTAGSSDHVVRTMGEIHTLSGQVGNAMQGVNEASVRLQQLSHEVHGESEAMISIADQLKSRLRVFKLEVG